MRSASQSSMRSNRSGIGIAGCKPSLTPLPPDPASLVCTEYEAAASGARCTDSGLVQTDGDRRPSRSTNGSRYPRLVPSDLRLGLWQHRLRGSRDVGVLLKPYLKPPCSGCVPASSSAQRQWRSLGARSMLDARSFMISTLRSQVSFAAAVAHSRLRLSRLELIGGALAAHCGRTAGRYASAARAFISPTAFEQARGGALGAGGGRVGFAGGGLF